MNRPSPPPHPQPGYQPPPEPYPYVHPHPDQQAVVQTPPQLVYSPVKQARRGRRWLAWAIASALAIPLGGYGGMWLGRTWGAIANGPTDVQTVAADFPNVADRYLRGVTVASVAQDWLMDKKSWKCEATNASNSSVSEARKRTGCAPSGKTSNDLRVTIMYDDEKRVRSVNLRCDYGPGDKTCQQLFTDLAGVVMASDERLRKQAVDWTRANIDSDESIVIGTTKLAATLSPHYLDFTAAG